jgi:CHAT domain-containing protein/tetratricopeptide (TPR) repeat protein
LAAIAVDGGLLETGKAVEAELISDRPHEYRFRLESGQYARITVSQRSVQTVVAVLDPGRRRLFEVTNTSIGETAKAEVVASEAGTWAVVIAAADPGTLPGRYAVTVEETAIATGRHRARAAGSQAGARAVSAIKGDARESVLEGIALYECAFGQWRAAEDRENEAITLYSIAYAYAGIGEKEKALRYAAEALSAARDSGSDFANGWALQTAGAIHNAFGDRKKAIEYHLRALPLMRKAQNRAGEAATLNDLGIAHNGLGEIRGSLGYFTEALSILNDLKDTRRLATLHSNIGYLHASLGDYSSALEHYGQALSLHRAAGNRSGEAIVRNNMGSAYSSLADYQKGLDAYLSALEIQRSLGRDWNVAICLHNVAWVHAILGDRKRARTVYLEALEILRKVKDQAGMSNTLNNLGETSAGLEDYAAALAYYNEALALRRAVGDRKGEAVSLASLGKTYAKIGQKEKARQNLDLAVTMLRAPGDPRRLAAALLASGVRWREDGNPEKAWEALSEALAIGRDIRDRRAEADALAELARVERDRGNMVLANQRAGEALAALEELRLTVTSPSLRAWFFAMKRDVLEMQIDLLMCLHADRPGERFDGAALLASERSKARSLLELLGESGAGIRRGVDSALLDREQELQRLIFAKAEQQTRTLNSKSAVVTAGGIAKELDALTTEMEHVQSRIRSTSPAYAALARPEPLGLPEIRKRVLDDNTVLLEFFLGAGRSFLWSVSTSSIDAYVLPPRSEIELSVRRAYELLTARNRNPANETPGARTLRIRQADGAYVTAAAGLSRMLLGQAAAKLAGKRLLIVADGALQYLPFASLPEPAPDGAKAPPLAVDHEIVMAPSASTVALIRESVGGRSPAPKSLAVVADPVFSAADARVAPASGRGSGPEEFARLRFSRTEADEITRLAGADEAFRALDFDASRETVLSEEFGRHRIVHFATHALLDNEHPELSSVVLSRVDRDGHPRNGFLRLYDIYNLRLGSDLVVLSACETALGSEIRGEGLIGLTRGFLYAGAPRVVATLWKVDDRATSEVMKRFYEAMLKRGERPAAALRSAQAAMSKTKGWDAPHNWAAFTIQGEWR